jgi:gluconokinase
MVALLMGTTGAGKTTVGTLLAQKLGWKFLDADDFHSPENVEKMRSGIPLTDADRAPWLAAIHAELVRQSAATRNVVLGCSALKQKYRDVLARDIDLRLVYLKGSYDTMRQHIEARHGHFAGESILAAQFADLEEPRDAIIVDVRKTPEIIVKELQRAFGAD